MTDFAPKMIIHLAPGHSDISKMRFWENARKQEMRKKRLQPCFFRHSLQKRERAILFLGKIGRFWGVFGDFAIHFTGGFADEKEKLQREMREKGFEQVQNGLQNV